MSEEKLQFEAKNGAYQDWFYVPPEPKWRFRLTKEKNYATLFHSVGAPNRFHRWMQKIFLGIYWDKI